MIYFALIETNYGQLWKFAECCYLLSSSEAKIKAIAFFYTSQSLLRLASVICGVFFVPHINVIF